MNREEELEAELQRVRIEHAAALYEQGMKNIARMYHELNKARQEEREACAQLIESHKSGVDALMDATRDMEAEAIRCRGRNDKR